MKLIAESLSDCLRRLGVFDDLSPPPLRNGQPPKNDDFTRISQRTTRKCSCYAPAALFTCRAEPEVGPLIHRDSQQPQQLRLFHAPLTYVEECKCNEKALCRVEAPPIPHVVLSF